MIGSEILTGGFADPVFQSQAVFRKVLDAFSRPGTIVAIPDAVSAPPPLYASTAAFLCTFADDGTPVHFDRDMSQADAAAAWVRFHTGASVAELPAFAQFAVVIDSERMPSFEGFSVGSQEYPDRSATIVIQIEDFAGGTALRLEGPGIDGTAEASPRPLPEDFVARMQRNRSLFPRGVDVVLASPREILALPRSVRVTTAARG